MPCMKGVLQTTAGGLEVSKRKSQQLVAERMEDAVIS